MASGNCEDGEEAAGETEGATGKAHMEVLYLLEDFCIHVPNFNPVLVNKKSMPCCQAKDCYGLLLTQPPDLCNKSHLAYLTDLHSSSSPNLTHWQHLP